MAKPRTTEKRSWLDEDRLLCVDSQRAALYGDVVVFLRLSPLANQRTRVVDRARGVERLL